MLVCNTTPVRTFTIVGQLDVLVDVLDGTVRAPRHVLDPDDDFATPPDLLSEIGQTERFFATRSRDPEAGEIRARFAELRTRPDVEVVDLTDHEAEIYMELRSLDYSRSHGLAGELGRGESATMAIAEARAWGVVMDDAVARQALAERSPEAAILTSRQLLRQAATRGIVDSGCAQRIYDGMLASGYRGPGRLF